MQIQLYVNAMAAFAGRHTRVLCDPWVTTNLTSRSNIYNYPPLSLDAEAVAAKGFTHLHISHGHPDHFDPDTLRAFPRDIAILIADWPDNFLARNLRSLGFTNVHIVEWTHGIDLGHGDHMWAKVSAAYKDVDSLAVFRLDNEIVLNTNDCGFVQAEMREIAARFPAMEVAVLAASLVGPYPQFYENLTVQEKASEAAKKKRRNLDNLHQQIAILKPKVTLPFGGGVLYGGNKTGDHLYTGVASQTETRAYFEENPVVSAVAVLPPLGAYDVTAGLVLSPDQPELSEEELHAYRATVASKPWIFDEGQDFYIAPHLRVNLTPLFKAARQKLRSWQEIKNVRGDMNVFFDVDQPFVYQLNFDTDDVRTTTLEEAKRTKPMMLFRVPYSLMVGLLTRHFNFNNVGTPFIGFYRDPNVFNPDHLLILVHLHV